MKAGIKNILNAAMIAAACLLLIFISGLEGCGGGTTASKTGLDFSVTEGTDYVSSGKTLNLGDGFYVGVKIENYDKQARAGYVCIRDNIADSFGGIRDEECRPFSVRAAEATNDKKGIEPGTVEVSFPTSGEYSYYGMPEMVAPYSAELMVSLKYAESNLASGTVTVPNPQQPAISQEPSPIAVSVTKSIHKQQDSYKISLDISLRRQQDARIFSPDFSRENMTYFSAKLEPNAMECKTQDGAQANGLVELKNERLIKCSSIVNPVGEESYPLTITLDYGVSIEKKYPFNIKTGLE